MRVDVAVIGGGILGCTMARALSRFDVEVAVFEAKPDIGEGATKANSGLIHTGFQARGGSLKGLSCVQGNARYSDIVEELDIPYRKTGALFVAFHPEGLEKIAEKRMRAFENGAGMLDVLSGEEARSLEPRLSPQVIAAMAAPSTGIISPFELLFATARNAAANGVVFECGFEVSHIERVGGRWLLQAKNGCSVSADYVVNVAGEEAALLEAQVRPADLKVSPRRGQYIVFDKQVGFERGFAGDNGSALTLPGDGEPIRHVLFQAQESDEGGTLLAPTIDGNLLVGPTSENVRSFSDNATTPEGLEHVKRVARKLIPDLDFRGVITQFAGIRANISNVDKEKKDFVVRISAPGFVSTLGIKNPGMTSAPVLVDKALGLLEEEGLRLVESQHFDPSTQGSAHERPFMHCTRERQRDLLASDERFGRIVCRCERITEGDIRRVLHESPAPHSLDGIKRRLRVGMGRCQGSFCTPRVLAIMADELGCAPAEIPFNEHGARLVVGRVK